MEEMKPGRKLPPLAPQEILEMRERVAQGMLEALQKVHVEIASELQSDSPKKAAPFSNATGDKAI
jgi:hypothetical protein